MPLWKRSADIALGLAALPFLLAGLLLIAFLHRLVSPGPIFFRQERVGYRGRRFRLYKFRTMTAGADAAPHQAHLHQLMEASVPMEKMDAKGDARIIPGGGLLRASGLDELPQLLNVLRGDMSLVGPRPCLPFEYEKYLPEQRRRFEAVPGLTGLWQVSGKNRTTFAEMIRLDVEYVRTRSAGLDLKILCLTLPAILRQMGDARRAKRRAGAAGPKPESLADPPPAIP